MSHKSKQLELQTLDKALTEIINSETLADQALRTLQNKVKNYINTTGHNISLLDELIEMRKNESNP